MDNREKSVSPTCQHTSFRMPVSSNYVTVSQKLMCRIYSGSVKPSSSSNSLVGLDLGESHLINLPYTTDNCEVGSRSLYPTTKKL